MNEMIEREARAICRAFHGRFSDTPQAELNATVERYWTGYVDIATAAIEVMREPTYPIIAAGAAADNGEDRTIGFSGAEEVWQLMIDAALKQT